MNQVAAPLFVPSGLRPTSEQRDIQLARSRVTLVEANAGAAKTTTLALRIGEALARGLSPESIVALTFTREARHVMRARLVEIGISSAIATRVHVCTMDEFAHEVLASIDDAMPQRLSSNQNLRDAALQALENVSLVYQDKKDLLDIRTHNTAISQFLDTLLRLKATMAFDRIDETLDLEFVAEDLGVTLTDYLWALEYEKLRIGLFDEVQFRGPLDATYDLARRLRDVPDTKAYLPVYRLVTGDELHDLNEASFRVLEAMLLQEDLYFVGAGDRDQVIHTQVGADQQFLAKRFSSAVRYPLTMTYRHGPHLAYAMQAFKNKRVDSALTLYTRIELLAYSDEQIGSCADRVVQALSAWKLHRQPLDGCAILLRDRHQSIEIENALMRADVGYRTETMPSYLLREEILFLRGMLAIALADLNAVQSPLVRGSIVEALATFGEVPLSPKELDEAKRTITRDPDTLRHFFEGQIKRVGNIHISGQISSAVQLVRTFSSETPAHEALRMVCDLLDIDALARRIYVSPYDAAVIARSVDGFIAMARQSAMSLRDFYNWLGIADEFVSSSRRKNLVLVECAAHSKGKEFEHVLLPFLDDREFPNPMHSLQEEENLFYVAATRARARLTLIAPSNKLRRSRFLAGMQLDETGLRADAVLRRMLPLQAASPARLDLKVAFEDKDIVKALGAKWDAVRKVWYLLPNQDPAPFHPWLPKH